VTGFSSGIKDRTRSEAAGVPVCRRGAVFATAVLCSIVICAPLPLGSTGQVANFSLELLSLLVIATIAAGSGVLSVNVLAVLFVAAVTGLQIVPLPPGLSEFLSPDTTALWRAHDRDATARWLPISVNPGLTAATGLRILLYLSLMCAIAQILKCAAYRKWIIRALAVSALILLALGVGFPAERDKTRIVMQYFDLRGPVDWWRTPAKQPWQTGAFGTVSTARAGGLEFGLVNWGVGDGFGPYVVSNHYAAGVYLCLPAAAGMIWASRLRWLSYYGASFAAAILYAVAVYVIAVLADSRAGAAATILTALVFFSLVGRSGFQRRTFTALAAIYSASAFGFLIAWHSGVLEVIADLVPSLGDSVTPILADPRATATAFAGKLFSAAPFLGMGLGTYGELFTVEAPTKVVVYYAHNEYAQTLAEAGCVGLAGVLVGLIWMVQRFFEYLRNTTGDQRQAGAVAWSGLAGLTLHSGLDWNLHVPANVVIACVLGGLAVASSYKPSEPSVPTRGGQLGLPSPRRHGVMVALALMLVAYLAREGGSDYGESRLRKALAIAVQKPEQLDRRVAIDGLNQAISDGKALHRWNPENAQLAVLLGDAYLLRAALERGANYFGDLAEADFWLQKAHRCAAVQIMFPRVSPDS